MKTPKRILVAHADAHTRRMLTMLLVEGGLSVQAVEPEVAAVIALSEERFDLALIGQLTLGDELFALAAPLREAQPGLPIVMLFPELELPLVVQGIRHGLTDVLPLRTDPKPVIRRILTLVGLAPDLEPTAAELAEVEATLAQLDPNLVVPAADQDIVAQRDQLRQGLRELNLEREVIAAAQAGMDEKARLLGLERAALRRERQELAAEVEDLQEEGAELDAAWQLIYKRQKAIDVERRNLENSERDLRQRENLSASYARPPFPVSTPPVVTDIQVEQGWEELERARASLESERAMFRDERMSLLDLDRQIKHREDQLRGLGEQVRDLDRKRRGLPPPPPKAFVKTRPLLPPASKPSLFRKLMGNRL